MVRRVGKDADLLNIDIEKRLDKFLSNSMPVITRTRSANDFFLNFLDIGGSLVLVTGS